MQPLTWEDLTKEQKGIMVPIDFNPPLRWGGGEGVFNRDFDVLPKSKHYSKVWKFFLGLSNLTGPRT